MKELYNLFKELCNRTRYECIDLRAVKFTHA
jgi:hypothetical protein